MAIPNRISAVLPDEAKTAIASALETIASRLPFLADLSPPERDSLIYLGDRNKQLVVNSLALVKQKNGFLPRDFSVEEFEKDVRLAEEMYSIKQQVAALLQRITDTTNLVGSEAYAASLAIYGFASNSHVNTEGIDPYLDDLAKRFTRKSKGAAPANPQNPQK